MNDAVFKLRVPTSELEAWRIRAKKEGRPLAAWIRMRCKDMEFEIKSDALGPADDVEVKVKFVNKPKTCIHGTTKGYNCWQCGGIAVIECGGSSKGS